MEARVEQDLHANPMKKLAELLQEAGAIPVIDGVSIYEDHVSMSKPRFQQLMAELATLRADGTKAAEEIARLREENIKLLNDASVWRNRAIGAEEEIREDGRGIDLRRGFER